MENYDEWKLRAQSAEEYVRNFLDVDVKPVWPVGWMQTRFVELAKYSYAFIFVTGIFYELTSVFSEFYSRRVKTFTANGRTQSKLLCL